MAGRFEGGVRHLVVVSTAMEISHFFKQIVGGNHFFIRYDQLRWFEYEGTVDYALFFLC